MGIGGGWGGGAEDGASDVDGENGDEHHPFGREEEFEDVARGGDGDEHQPVEQSDDVWAFRRWHGDGASI